MKKNTIYYKVKKNTYYTTYANIVDVPVNIKNISTFMKPEHFPHERYFVFPLLWTIDSFEREYSLYINTKQYPINWDTEVYKRYLKIFILNEIVNNTEDLSTISFKIPLTVEEIDEWAVPKQFSKLTLICKNKKNFNKFVSMVISIIKGAMYGWKVELAFINLNFKIYTDAISKAITCFIGNTHGIKWLFNTTTEDIKFVIKKKKKRLIIYSFSLPVLTQLVKRIIKLKPYSKYKNKGIKEISGKRIYKPLKEGKSKQR